MAYKKNYNKSGGNKSSSDVAMEKFAEMLIKRMEEMKESNWKQGWITSSGSSFVGMPQNISGRPLSGSNAFFLQLHSMMNNFSMPVYMTFLQAKDYGLAIKEKSQSVPVVYWSSYYKEKTDKTFGQKPKIITCSEYDNLPEEEKDKYEKKSVLKYFPEFNVDQTNLKEVKPELYAKLQKKFKAPEVKETQDTVGMYSNAAIDRMLEKQEWLCPVIWDKTSSSAFYRPSADTITIPMKSQFNIGKTPEEIYQDGMEYYSTFIHEAVHSTGSPNRLNRKGGAKFGDNDYGVEECVAEMADAVVGATLGFSSRIQENNINYIKGWIDKIRQEPKFLLNIITDVGKASTMVLNKINEQKLALGEKNIMDFESSLTEEDSKELRMAAFEKKSIDMIVKSVSDASTKKYSEIQKQTFNEYVLAACDAKSMSHDNKETVSNLLSSLFDKAETILKQNNIEEEWIESGRREILDLSEDISKGVVKSDNEQSQGIKM